MTFSRKHAAVLLATLATAATVVLLGHAQSQSQAAPGVQTMNRNVVVLDPAHGGPDAGAKLDDGVLEKDVALALAARLRAALTAAGFMVVSTREADSFNPLSTDQRAETANRAHAVACIVIHATASGTGVHLYASTLAPKDAPEAGGDQEFEPTPWDAAQAESVRQSLRLQSDLSTALGTANLPVAAGRASVRPLDNLVCPAVAVEVAPLVVAGEDTTAVTDPDYQQRVAKTLAQGLQAWRGHAEPARAGVGRTP